MNAERPAKQNKGLMVNALRALILLVLLALCVSLVVYAWFRYERDAAALAELSDPTAIYINAANREEIRYMDMSGIDVEGETDGYKDFVFCIRGDNVGSYRLQLAYTTNNQFSYELYPANQLVSGSVPANAVGVALYTTHPVSGTIGPEQTYYIAPGTSPIVGDFLNKNTGASEILAYDDSYPADQYHTLTYDDYDIVHKYAWPIYWQARNLIHPISDAYGSFCDYYILRVIWNSGATNTKETDIIYISARNTSN